MCDGPCHGPFDGPCHGPCDVLVLCQASPASGGYPDQVVVIEELPFRGNGSFNDSGSDFGAFWPDPPAPAVAYALACPGDAEDVIAVNVVGYSARSSVRSSVTSGLRSSVRICVRSCVKSQLVPPPWGGGSIHRWIDFAIADRYCHMCEL